MIILFKLYVLRHRGLTTTVAIDIVVKIINQTIALIQNLYHHIQATKKLFFTCFSSMNKLAHEIVSLWLKNNNSSQSVEQKKQR